MNWTLLPTSSFDTCHGKQLVPRHEFFRRSGQKGSPFSFTVALDVSAISDSLLSSQFHGSWPMQEFIMQLQNYICCVLLIFARESESQNPGKKFSLQSVFPLEVQWSRRFVDCCALDLKSNMFIWYVFVFLFFSPLHIAFYLFLCCDYQATTSSWCFSLNILLASLHSKFRGTNVEVI